VEVVDGSVMNKGEMKEKRLDIIQKLLELMEQYRHVDQYV
jgi:hypothetical protein